LYPNFDQSYANLVKGLETTLTTTVSMKTKFEKSRGVTFVFVILSLISYPAAGELVFVFSVT
jgi:hypothetical protein